MKKFFNYFLFQKRPGPALSGGKKLGFWAWNTSVLLASAVGITLVSLLLAVGSYSTEIAKGYFECPLIFLMNLLPVAALLFLLYAATGRAGLSFLLTCLPVLGFAVGNYYKLAFRDDPVMFADLFILKEVGDMAGKYHLFLDKQLAVALACVVLGWLFLHFFVRGRPARRARLIGSVLALLALCGAVALCLSDSIYSKTAYYDRLNNRWSSTQQYIARGGFYPFLHSINDAIETPPEGYDKETAAAILAEYQDADIPEEQKVNVMAIMLEAYSDFSGYESIDFAQDVYQVWHDLEAEGYSGNLITNIFAGGTIDTERCFLTGYSSLNNFRSSTNSYVWYFRDQGYTTEGMHPCYQWFYNRVNVNEYLGFENYYFSENYFAELTGGIAYDDIFFPELMATYREVTAEDKPYFSFSVTYQGHGPYETNSCYWGELGDFVVYDGKRSTEEQYILDNYFGSIANTNEHLKELTDYLREDDEPVVLILFGDHKPWMGDGNSVYESLGISFDLGTEEGFYNYYATRYIIWANDAAKEILGSDFQGEGPDISPCFLMNLVFDQCGWEGSAYMQATDQIYDQLPVVQVTGRYLEDGVLIGELTESGKARLSRYEWVQYYWRNHFSY